MDKSIRSAIPASRLRNGPGHDLPAPRDEMDRSPTEVAAGRAHEAIERLSEITGELHHRLRPVSADKLENNAAGEAAKQTPLCLVVGEFNSLADKADQISERLSRMINELAI